MVSRDPVNIMAACLALFEARAPQTWSCPAGKHECRYHFLGGIKCFKKLLYGELRDIQTLFRWFSSDKVCHITISHHLSQTVAMAEGGTVARGGHTLENVRMVKGGVKLVTRAPSPVEIAH